MLRGVALAALLLAAPADGELAPSGKLRVGVVAAPKPSAFFVVEEAGKPRGVTVDLGQSLARTLGAPVEFLVAHNSGELTDALEQGRIDVAFLPVDDERRKRVAFGPAYVQFESTCLVLGSAPFRAVRDLDRPGVRVGGEANTTTIRAASTMLKSATVVPIRSIGEALALLKTGEIDAFALGRTALATYQAEIPGSRILEGSFHSTSIAIAVPRNRPAALARASAFLEEAKTSGAIRRALDRAGLQSIPVAP